MSAKQRAIPAWQQALIVANQRKLAVKQCPRCTQTVLCGLDNDQCALPAVADPALLTWPGELATQQTGLRTYTVAARELTRRTPRHARAPSPWPVVPEHACGRPVPAAWQHPAETPTRKDTTDAPPF